MAKSLNNFNPSTPNIKEQILVSCPHSFLMKGLRKCQKCHENSHDPAQGLNNLVLVSQAKFGADHC